AGGGGSRDVPQDALKPVMAVPGFFHQIIERDGMIPDLKAPLFQGFQAVQHPFDLRVSRVEAIQQGPSAAGKGADGPLDRFRMSVAWIIHDNPFFSRDLPIAYERGVGGVPRACAALIPSFSGVSAESCSAWRPGGK